MKRNEIYKIYNDKVKEYMDNGYCIYPYTMGGSQGEICKIDLFKGKEVIRIYMDHEPSFEEYFDYLFIVVGKYMQGKYENDTIWTDDLEIIEKNTFYEIDRDKWYVIKNEIKDIKELKEKRINYRFWKNNRCLNVTYTDNNRKKIVLKFMKRQPKCKSIKLSDIENVTKNVYRDGKSTYVVTAKNKTYFLK